LRQFHHSWGLCPGKIGLAHQWVCGCDEQSCQIERTNRLTLYFRGFGNPSKGWGMVERTDFMSQTADDHLTFKIPFLGQNWIQWLTFWGDQYIVNHWIQTVDLEVRKCKKDLATWKQLPMAFSRIHFQII
jgi:hypothetical protein